MVLFWTQKPLVWLEFDIYLFIFTQCYIDNHGNWVITITAFHASQQNRWRIFWRNHNCKEKETCVVRRAQITPTKSNWKLKMFPSFDNQYFKSRRRRTLFFFFLFCFVFFFLQEFLIQVYPGKWTCEDSGRVQREWLIELRNSHTLTLVPCVTGALLHLAIQPVEKTSSRLSLSFLTFSSPTLTLCEDQTNHLCHHIWPHQITSW